MVSVARLVVACAACAIVGGLASGVVVSRWGGDQPEPKSKTKPKAERPRAQPADDSAVEARLAELERQLEAVRRSQNARAALTKYAEALGAEEPEDGAKKPKTQAGAGVDGEDPVFELAVRSVMDRVDWERDEQRKAVRQQQRDERASRQTSLLTERLGLTEAQAQAVSTVLIRQMDSFRALRDRDGASETPPPATRSEWRERLEAIRKQTESELAEHLSKEQLEAYRSFAEDEAIGGGGFGRGGRGNAARAEGTSAEGRSADSPSGPTQGAAEAQQQR